MQENQLNRIKALRWWRNTLSMYEQDKYLEKHFPNRFKSNVRQNLSNIEEIYNKEVGELKPTDAGYEHTDISKLATPGFEEMTGAD